MKDSEYIEKEITYKELYKLHKTKEYEIQVITPSGWCDVNEVFTKNDLRGYDLTFENGSKIRCSYVHYLATPNDWTTSSDLQINDEVYDYNFNKIKLIKKTPVVSQTWYDFEVNNKESWYIQNNLIHHNSGKSLIIYMLFRLFNYKKLKGMLIVPSVSLTSQMFSDFSDYFYEKENILIDKIKEEKDDIKNALLKSELEDIYKSRELLDCKDIESNVAIISSGADKYTKHNFKISTFQSLSINQDRIDRSYFEDKDAIIVDETHKASSTTIKDILEASNKAEIKIGMSGSLSDDVIENLTIEGLLGQVKKIVSMRELIDLGLATEIIVHPILLQYPLDMIKQVKKMSYAEESKFLRNSITRAKFLAKLINSFKDTNVMLIYKNIDVAELILEEVHNLRNPEVVFDKKVKNSYRKENESKLYYVSGSTKDKDREIIRKLIINSIGNIMIGTTQIISTGLNIPSLGVTVLENVGKSITLVIQSLGRGARLHEGKKVSKVYDIVDDLIYTVPKSGRQYDNYSMKHFKERLDIYYREEYKIASPVKINLDFSKDDELLF